MNLNDPQLRHTGSNRKDYIVQLLRRFCRESIADVHISLVKKIEDELNDVEACNENLCLSSSYASILGLIYSSLRNSAGDQFRERSTNVLAVFGRILINAKCSSEYFKWISDKFQLSNSTLLKVSLLNALEKSLSFFEVKSTFPMQKQAFTTLEILLENQDSFPFMQLVANSILSLSNKFPMCFAQCSHGFIDILIGWYIDAKQNSDVAEYVQESLVSVSWMWTEKQQLALTLTAQLIEDIEKHSDELQVEVNDQNKNRILEYIYSLFRVYSILHKSISLNKSSCLPRFHCNRHFFLLQNCLLYICNFCQNHLRHQFLVAGCIYFHSFLSCYGLEFIFEYDGIFRFVNILLQSIIYLSNIEIIYTCAFLQQLLKKMNSNLATTLTNDIFNPLSNFSMLRFSSCNKVKNSYLRVYVAAFDIRDNSVLEQIYKYIISELLVCHKCLSGLWPEADTEQDKVILAKYATICNKIQDQRHFSPYQNVLVIHYNIDIITMMVNSQDSFSVFCSSDNIPSIFTVFFKWFCCVDSAVIFSNFSSIYSSIVFFFNSHFKCYKELLCEFSIDESKLELIQYSLQGEYLLKTLINIFQQKTFTNLTRSCLKLAHNFICHVNSYFSRSQCLATCQLFEKMIFCLIDLAMSVPSNISILHILSVLNSIGNSVFQHMSIHLLSELSNLAIRCLDNCHIRLNAQVLLFIDLLPFDSLCFSLCSNEKLYALKNSVSSVDNFTKHRRKLLFHQQSRIVSSEQFYIHMNTSFYLDLISVLRESSFNHEAVKCCLQHILFRGSSSIADTFLMFSSLNLFTFWISESLAQFLVNNCLKIYPFKRQENSLHHLEELLFIAIAHKDNVVFILNLFISLERYFYLATDGVTTISTPFDKNVRTFFTKNRETCNSWLDRLRYRLINYVLEHNTSVDCISMLQVMCNLSNTSAKLKKANFRDYFILKEECDNLFGYIDIGFCNNDLLTFAKYFFLSNYGGYYKECNELVDSLKTRYKLHSTAHHLDRFLSSDILQHYVSIGSYTQAVEWNTSHHRLVAKSDNCNIDICLNKLKGFISCDSETMLKTSLDFEYLDCDNLNYKEIFNELCISDSFVFGLENIYSLNNNKEIDKVKEYISRNFDTNIIGSSRFQFSFASILKLYSTVYNSNDSHCSKFGKIFTPNLSTNLSDIKSLLMVGRWRRINAGKLSNSIDMRAACPFVDRTCTLLRKSAQHELAAHVLLVTYGADMGVSHTATAVTGGASVDDLRHLVDTFSQRDVSPSFYARHFPVVLQTAKLIYIMKNPLIAINILTRSYSSLEQFPYRSLTTLANWFYNNPSYIINNKIQNMFGSSTEFTHVEHCFLISNEDIVTGNFLHYLTSLNLQVETLYKCCYYFSKWCFNHANILYSFQVSSSRLRLEDIFQNQHVSRLPDIEDVWSLFVAKDDFDAESFANKLNDIFQQSPMYSIDKIYARIIELYTTTRLTDINLFFSKSLLGFFRCLKLGFESTKNKYNRTIESILHVIHLMRMNLPELNHIIVDRLPDNPACWRIALPQLFSNLSLSECVSVSDCIIHLLCEIAKIDPQSVTFPSYVGSTADKTQETISRRVHEQLIFNLRRTAEIKSVDDLSIIVHEWRRITLLNHEIWLNVLSEHHAELSRRLCLVSSELDAIFNSFEMDEHSLSQNCLDKFKSNIVEILCFYESAYEKTFRNPETKNEIDFQNEFGEKISNAMKLLRNPKSLILVKPLLQTWNSLLADLKTYSSSLRNPYNLRDISPVLSDMKDTFVPVPGLSGQFCPYISSFHEKVCVLPTKTKPKRIMIYGSNGKRYAYLLKGLEDLHLDERLMQVLDVVNRLLSDIRSTTNCFCICNYSIIPIGYCSGLIQWVPGCTPLFSLYKRWQQRKLSDNDTRDEEVQLIRPSEQFSLKLKSVLAAHSIPTNISRRKLTSDVLLEVFDSLSEETSSEIFSRELWCSAVSSAAWYKMTRTFTTSLAVMSMVGYLIGLGDRHLDNLLLDLKTGELVHIDYNVCFEKGLTLRIPEKVPFRLTQNIVGVMDSSNMKPCFYSWSCKILEHLRKSSNIFLLLFHTYIFDPLIDWKNSTGNYILDIFGMNSFSEMIQSSMKNVVNDLQTFRTQIFTQIEMLSTTICKCINVSKMEVFDKQLICKADAQLSDALHNETNSLWGLPERYSLLQDVNIKIDAYNRELDEISQDLSTWRQKYLDSDCLLKHSIFIEGNFQEFDKINLFISNFPDFNSSRSVIQKFCSDNVTNQLYLRLTKVLESILNYDFVSILNSIKSIINRFWKWGLFLDFIPFENICYQYRIMYYLSFISELEEENSLERTISTFKSFKLLKQNNFSSVQVINEARQCLISCAREIVKTINQVELTCNELKQNCSNSERCDNCFRDDITIHLTMIQLVFQMEREFSLYSDDQLSSNFSQDVCIDSTYKHLILSLQSLHVFNLVLLDNIPATNYSSFLDLNQDFVLLCSFYDYVEELFREFANVILPTIVQRLMKQHCFVLEAISTLEKFIVDFSLYAIIEKLNKICLQLFDDSFRSTINQAKTIKDNFLLVVGSKFSEYQINPDGNILKLFDNFLELFLSVSKPFRNAMITRMDINQNTEVYFECLDLMYFLKFVCTISLIFQKLLQNVFRLLGFPSSNIHGDFSSFEDMYDSIQNLVYKYILANMCNLIKNYSTSTFDINMAKIVTLSDENNNNFDVKYFLTSDFLRDYIIYGKTENIDDGCARILNVSSLAIKQVTAECLYKFELLKLQIHKCLYDCYINLISAHMWIFVDESLTTDIAGLQINDHVYIFNRFEEINALNLFSSSDDNFLDFQRNLQTAICCVADLNMSTAINEFTMQKLIISLDFIAVRCQKLSAIHSAVVLLVRNLCHSQELSNKSSYLSKKLELRFTNILEGLEQAYSTRNRHVLSNIEQFLVTLKSPSTTTDTYCKSDAKQWLHAVTEIISLRHQTFSQDNGASIHGVMVDDVIKHSEELSLHVSHLDHSMEKPLSILQLCSKSASVHDSRIASVYLRRYKFMRSLLEKLILFIHKYQSSYNSQIDDDECLKLCEQISTELQILSDFRQLLTIFTVHENIHQLNYNEYGWAVWKRLKQKLEGRDPNTQHMSSVEEQVRYVIDESTSRQSLALMYEGWTSWI